MPRLLYILTISISITIAPYQVYAFLGLFGDEGIEFDVVIEGIPSEKADRYNLEELARETINPDSPPQTVSELDALTGLMADRMRKALVSEGYFEAYVKSDLLAPNEDENKKDIPVIAFSIRQGTRYTVSGYDIKWNNPENKSVISEEEFSLKKGVAARSERVIDVTEEIKDYLSERNCFLSLTVTPSFILNRRYQTAQAIITIDHGPEAYFGNTTITGDSTVEKDILKRYIRWKKGECFQQEKIDATQLALLSSQLISSTRITVGQEPDKNQQVPVTLDINDRAHRTIGAGVTFGTDEGLGVNGRWEHRNLYHRAHHLTTRARVNKLERSLNAEYRIPFFMDKGMAENGSAYFDRQNLVITSALKDETTDTFDSRNIAILGQLERTINDTFKIGAGLGARFSNIQEVGKKTENYGLLYTPAFAEWDSRDNPTDARKGLYARASFTPYTDVTGQGISFTKIEGVAQTYLTASDWLWEPTLALRASYGQINGAEAADIPADLRFYSGGGGSVRGYDFRALGPRQAGGEPAGGTILTEGTAELRLRFTEEYGAVAFVDAGNVYDESLPSFSEELFFSAGVGARYFSPLGALRFDVGVPLDKVEDSGNFGIYVSIGQAF